MARPSRASMRASRNVKETLVRSCSYSTNTFVERNAQVYAHFLRSAPGSSLNRYPPIPKGVRRVFRDWIIASWQFLRLCAYSVLSSRIIDTADRKSISSNFFAARERTFLCVPRTSLNFRILEKRNWGKIFGDEGLVCGEERETAIFGEEWTGGRTPSVSVDRS